MTRYSAKSDSDSPQLVCRKDDPTLQQEGGEDSKQEAQAQGGEETLKVHVLQAGVWRPTQLNDLNEEGVY